MARFKKRRMNKRGSFRGFFKRKSRRSGGGSSGVKLLQIDSMIYGAVRSPISALASKYIPIPVIGTIGDELVMGGINYLIAKNMSGIFRDVAMKGLTIENARLGEAVAQGGIGLLGGAKADAYIYG